MCSHVCFLFPKGASGLNTLNMVYGLWEHHKTTRERNSIVRVISHPGSEKTSCHIDQNKVKCSIEASAVDL